MFASCTSLNKKYPKFGEDKLMTDTAIREVFYSNLPVFQQCVRQNTLLKNNKVVKLTFTITTEGKTKDIIAKTSKDKKLSSCVKQVVLNDLRFPRNVTGGYITVKQPLNFYPVKI